MSVPRISTAELFTSGPDAGLVILVGGVNSFTTNGGSPEVPNFGTCESTANISQATTTATDLFDETANSGAGAFTPTGPLHRSRGGYGYAFLDAGSHSGDLLVVGGECAVGGLSSWAIGSAAATSCDSTATKDYYELYSPSTGTWTLGTALPASTPANSPQSALLP